MKSEYVDDELHRRAKVRAAQEGVTLRSLVEEHIRQGLETGSAETTAGAVREPVNICELEASAARSEAGDPLAELEAQGTIVRGERLQREIAEVIAQVYGQLGLEPSQSPPPSVEEVKALLARHQRAHPEVPTLSQLVLDMREET
jgi:predicted nucleic acid-binding protein